MAASNAGKAATIDELYASRIGSTAALWRGPDTRRTEALATHLRDYAEHVMPFLSAALLDTRAWPSRGTVDGLGIESHWLGTQLPVIH